LVPQKAFLFRGTVEENLKIAQAKEFVIKLVPTFPAVNVKGSPLPELWLTESLVRSALREELKDATVIIVAQRVSSIMDADKWYHRWYWNP